MAMVDEVALRDQPPYLEDRTMGPVHSPVLDAMTTMEERERIEADYEWFRYSKFALPFILFNGIITAVLICLSFWFAGSDYTHWRNGNPRHFELPTKADDNEGGIPLYNRNMRIASFSIGFFGLIGILLTMYIKPAPALRKVMYMAFAFILFVCGVLAAIAGALDAGNVSDAVWCRARERGTVPTMPRSCYDMSKMAVALTVVDLCLAPVAIFTALVLIVAAIKSFATPTDEEYIDPNAKPSGVSRTTRECLLILMFVNFLLLTLMFVFTIILHEGRDIRFADEAFYVREFNNLKPGWPKKNSRLRISACSVALGVGLINLIPFRSRVLSYICAFVYWICSCLFLVVFALDVKAVDTQRARKCPTGFVCTFAPFITVCVFDLWCAVMWLLYIIFEFIARLLLECRHCTRNYAMFEIRKHETETCSSRPVRCEVCAKHMPAKEFVYKHRFECGHDTRRCEQCGVLVAEWNMQKHKDECPKWPVNCQMCETAFARCDLPAHTATCPMTPASCEACGETVRNSEMSAHITTCRERPVACSNCGMQMPMYQFDAHSQTCQ